MKSFSILRTNTGLSSNIKIIVDSKYNLFLESIDSVPELSLNRFKKIQFNKGNLYDDLIPYFYKNFPVDLAFSVKYDNDNSNMSVDFANQYDDIYLAGARNIIENKNYTEEFEYFAPLYVFKHSIPKFFVIFRIDGPGLINLTKDNFRSEFLNNLKTVKVFDLTKNSALGEWIDNSFRINSTFPKAPLEVDFRKLEFTRWIGIDYVSGGFTSKSLFLDEKFENENTLFDLERFFYDGFRINKVVFPHIINFSFLYDDTPATPTSLRKWSLNRYSGFYLEDLELIDAITPFVLPELHSLITGTKIQEGNYLINTTYGDPFLNGYREDIDMWVEYLGDFYLVKKVIEESLEKAVQPIMSNDKVKSVTIEQVTNPNITRYKIISDLDLAGKESLLNQKSCFINTSNQIINLNTDSPYVISDFKFADINLIEINGVYHNLYLQNGILTLNTDYGFEFSENNQFSYYINSGEPGYKFTWDLLITKNNPPRNFKIYRAKFTDIKDFDTAIIDTEFSRFEYEKRNDLTQTEETKMYLTDLRSQSFPQDFDDFTFKGKTNFVPVASDYTANLETFRIEENNRLTDLWRKNPIHCRWGYQNSLSAYDYPYLLNNNDVMEDYNRTVNTQNSIPTRRDRNLDYFYTINSGTTSYLYHSLHVEKNYQDQQDSSFRFELDKYLELGTYSLLGTTYSYSFSYFDLFFSPTQSFMNQELISNKKKYSYFETGDRVEPNTTVFRGLKFRLFQVDNIKYDSVSINNINLFSSNLFQDYKFSILLSSNDYMVSNDITTSPPLYKPYQWDYFVREQDNNGNLSIVLSDSKLVNLFSIGDSIELDQFYPNINSQYQATASQITSTGSLTNGGLGLVLDKSWSGLDSQSSGIWRNKMQWQTIKNWQHDTKYEIGDLVMYEDTPYKVLNGATISNPLENPANLNSFYSVETNFTQFWNPSTTYVNFQSWVYRNQDYYIYDSGGSIDFWNPGKTYSSLDYVFYQDKFFQATYSTNPVPAGYRPIVENRKIQSSSGLIYWYPISSTFSALSKWKKVELWDKYRTQYTNPSFVIKDDILYSFTASAPATPLDIPGQSALWKRLYSFVSDTKYIYGTSATQNSIININDSYYYCKYNSNLTLDSGITVYINKKWKNVLVNIAINDNTIDSSSLSLMDETKNIERDYLYVETNGRLTAANFIKQINDLDSLYGFSDYTSYVVIEEDGSYQKYNFKNNLSNLPYMLICEEPDEVDIKNLSLRYDIQTVDKNVLKPSRILIDGLIDNLEKIDFYNNNPLGVNIINLKDEQKPMTNFNNQTNQIFQVLHRHSGYYMPIFYEIELFTSDLNIELKQSCDVQTVIWLGTASNPNTKQTIELTIKTNDTIVTESLILTLPIDDSQSEVSDYYQQIIQFIEQLSFLNDKSFTFDIYAPGDENIHPKMIPGYWVLSIKYPSDVCDLQITANQFNPCQNIFEFVMIERINDFLEILSQNPQNGILIPKYSQNLCCPECGPMMTSYLSSNRDIIIISEEIEFTKTTSSPVNLKQEFANVGRVKTPFFTFLQFYNNLNCANCPISATATNQTTWNSLQTQLTNQNITLTPNPDLEMAYQELNIILPQSYIRGIGSFGSPTLLQQLIDVIMNTNFDLEGCLEDQNACRKSILDTILDRGLVVGCDENNYYMYTNDGFYLAQENGLIDPWVNCCYCFFSNPESHEFLYELLNTQGLDYTYVLESLIIDGQELLVDPITYIINAYNGSWKTSTVTDLGEVNTDFFFFISEIISIYDLTGYTVQFCNWSKFPNTESETAIRIYHPCNSSFEFKFSTYDSNGSNQTYFVISNTGYKSWNNYQLTSNYESSCNLVIT